MGLLDGKVALVTGAASGIGQGTALRFAEEGASVCLADVQDDDGEATCKQIEAKGGKAVYIHTDVSDPAQVEAAVQKAIDTFGKLDVVFANAGINGVWSPIEELQPDEWDKTMNINLKGTYLTVHYAIPHLKAAGEGSIIITSSVNGNRTFSTAGSSAYSSSKAGQVAFMKMAALELGRYNIRVNAVCPGAIHTHIDERTFKRDTDEVEVKIEMPEGQPFLNGGQGEPVDVANTCVFLASPLAHHVSGVDIYVDGGASLLR